ncbi:hypothetical protein EVAR_92803_1 [Eumeta japonica]|uniref:Uncharacterized protein n=1 Tax=Eumeta variegata TaxID=151549 RepID=A0A4C2A2B6_EUMVA|nr:hypothetical protein EVAR_92803_1 [Eumeta japonica]
MKQIQTPYQANGYATSLTDRFFCVGILVIHNAYALHFTRICEHAPHLWECRCNASDFERHPNLERYPDHCVFIIVHRSLTEGGHFPNQIQAGGRPSFPYEEGVLQEVADEYFRSWN